MSNSLSTWTPQSAPLPAAGWFTDPASVTRLRWWDGTGWTDHTMDAPDVSLATPTPQIWTPPAAAADEPLRRERRRDRGGRSRGAAEVPPVPPAPDVPAHQTPYVPYSQQYSPMRMLTPQRVPGSPNTRGIWGLALLPLFFDVVVVGLYLGGVITPPTSPSGLYQADQSTQALYSLGLVLAQFLVMILLVVADRSALNSRNINPASGWWLLLLPPLAYFIARRVVLKRQGVISNAPGNLYVLALFLPYAAVILTGFLTGLSSGN